jgi:hypothetical protein
VSQLHGENDMPKSEAEVMESVRKLFASYSAFQRTRPDLPQGEIVNLSKRDLKKVVDAYRLEKARPMLDKLNPTERRKMERAIRTGTITIRSKRPVKKP